MKWTPLKKFFALAAAAGACSVLWASSALAATGENVAAGATMNRVTMAANSSYMTDSYAGVLHLSVSDGGVACASVDSRNRIVVTGISEGSANVSFWYRTDVSSNWVSTILPVTVSGRANGAASTVTPAELGLIFPMSSLSLYQGGTATVKGIEVNGAERTAGQLLWVSSSDSYVTADKDTGLLTAVAPGSATVYAIDPATKSCASIVVTVS